MVPAWTTMAPWEYEAKNAHRLWTRCVPSAAGCWEWLGSTQKGYARLEWKGKNEAGSRVAFMLQYGPIPEGKHVLHDCDNPLCINPDHLRLGTHADNMRDISKHGRHWQANKTHCKQGHPFDAANTRFRYRDGVAAGRNCRACGRASAMRRAARAA